MATLPRLIFGAAYNYADTTAPTVSSAVINTAGTLLTVTCNKPVRSGGTTTGFALSTGQTLGTPTFNGTAVVTLSISPAVTSSETPTLAYTQPGNGVESIPNGIDLATFSGQSVTNNSTVSGGGTEVATYDFPEGTWGTISGTYWTIIDGVSIEKTNLGDFVVAGTSTDTAAVWAGAGAFNANQYAETTINDAGSPVQWMRNGPAVRCTTDNYYAAGVDVLNGRVYLYKVNAGTRTDLTDVAQAFASGDKLRLEVTGTGSATRLTVKRWNGSVWTTAINSYDPAGTYLDTGKPGIYAGVLASDQPGISYWAAGNL